MPAPQKKSPTKKIDVNVEIERKLIDSKIGIPRESSGHRLFRIIIYAIILGGLAGAGLVFYLQIARYEPGDQTYIPVISVPSDDLANGEEAATPTTTAEEAPPAPVQVAEILDTPTGTLNIRKGPGTNFAKIATAQPGEAYILVSTDEEKGWYEIKLADGSTGWITAQYAVVK